VILSLHVDYKNTRIKQYHKEGRTLRTETTINNTRDFGIGKLSKNLPALRQVGFQANRRLLDVQKISHDCSIGLGGSSSRRREAALTCKWRSSWKLPRARRVNRNVGKDLQAAASLFAPSLHLVKR
jgi:hypothetical protein